MPPDYSGQNLQGRSFKGQNLIGANFSKADIRGADFTNAILKGADFTGAKAGLQRHWVIGLLIAALLLSTLSGYFSITIGLFTDIILNTKNSEDFLIGILVLVIVTVFCIFCIRKGLIAGVGVVAVAIVLVFTVAVASFGSVSFSIVFAVAIALVVAIVLVFATAVAESIALSTEGFSVVGFGIGAVVGGISKLARYEGFPLDKYGNFTLAKYGVFVLVLIFFIFFITYIGWHISWHSLIGDTRDAWLRSFTIAFAATGGTSFCGADLTDADFTSATLKNTDFRTANLTRTRFYEAKKLNFARPGNTILANRAVLNLLVTLNGRNKSYTGANLRGANLIGADLKEANLKDADIIEATFQGVNLEWANLTLTQAIGTNFTQAQMTGACVEAWNIESTTILDNVDCRFVYLLEYPKPGTDDRERRPSSGEFQPGEFTKLFEEVLNTVDLIFRDGINWQAFVNAFKKVQVENGDTELTIQGIENKGDGVVVVKVAVPENADKEKIHSDFTQNYQIALAAVEEKYKAILQAKDDEIKFHREQSGKIPEMIMALANKPINVQVENKVENKNMTNDSSRNINVGRDFNVKGIINLGEISGAVTNTINELSPSPEPDKPGIKELLTQLKTAIEADTNLSEEDKADALEQIKTLAEVAKNPQEGTMQKAAKTAIKILKGTISSLPTAATLVEQCSKLLPLISSVLGLG